MVGERFSGTGVYKTTFNYNGENSLMLSLGKVKNSCEVIINGNSLGVKVYSPYNFKIERAYLKENNLLEIKVTNGKNDYLLATCLILSLYADVDEIQGMKDMCFNDNKILLADINDVCSVSKSVKVSILKLLKNSL